jgi:3',5'-cyclic AMP phosphodiesterase CpdA
MPSKPAPAPSSPPHRVARFGVIALVRLVGLVGLVGLVAAASAVRVAHASPAPARIAKGPYLTGLSDQGTDVRFELDASGAAVVEALREGDSDPPRVFDDHKADAFHVIPLRGLQPASRYSYTVRAGGAVLGTGRFATAPKIDSGAPLRFLVYGDDRTDPAAHQVVVRALEATPSDLLVNTGDLVEDGASADDWRSFFDTETPLLRNRPIFVSIGNHELYDDWAGANFARFFGLSGETGGAAPYGSVRVAGVRFFFLNGMHDWRSGDERHWLEGELASADAEPGLTWRVVVVHHGPWSAGPHGGNAKLLDAHVPELLAAHKVDLVLSGHDHIYERGDSGLLKYIVSGGGGAPLYRVEEPTATTRKVEAAYHFVEISAGADALRIVAHRLDGSTIEQCDLLKERPWGCDPVPWVAPASARGGRGAAAGSRAPQAEGAQQAPAASSRSRCGCEVPGGGPGSTPAAGVLLGLVGLVARGRSRALRRS